MVAALAFADCIHGYTYIYVGVYRYVLNFEQVTNKGQQRWSGHFESEIFSDQHSPGLAVDVHGLLGHTVRNQLLTTTFGRHAHVWECGSADCCRRAIGAFTYLYIE
jgi:hypothetical protein